MALNAPLFVYDLETTGNDPLSDYIISMSYMLVRPGENTPDAVTFLVNPGVEIPEASTAIHGISDADVADKPRFDHFAPQVAQILDDPEIILCGYNNRYFDDVVLERELRDAGFPKDLFAKPSLDLYALWRRGESRSLGGAVRRFLGRELENAHSAEADTRAVADLLPVMSEAFAQTLPDSAEALNAALFPEQASWVDRHGKITRNEQGEPALSFGKNKGIALKSLEKSYLQWMMNADFPDDTKAVIARYL